MQHKMISVSHFFGMRALKLCHNIMRFVTFTSRLMMTFLMPRMFKMYAFFEQIERIGIDSLGIVTLSGAFTGMVFALQSYIGFSRIGGEQFIGSVVALGMARELGPVLTGLMVTGRVGSAIAAELGTMRISEQIDALVTLCIDPIAYLVVPRICAGIVILPCLSLFSTLFGIAGGYIIVGSVLHLNAAQYLTNITQFCTFYDIIGGIIKASFFGLILTLIGCYKGYYASGGARGVGKATTESVVLSSTCILIANFFLTKLIDAL